MRRALQRVAWTVALAAFAALALPSEAKKRGKPPEYRLEEVTNFQLSPELSRWLVGPIAWIASEEEVTAFLRLGSDEEAETFIDEFWQRRAGEADSPWPTDQPRAVFAERAREADRIYSEGTRRGRTTDRGTVYILYGEPEDTFFETPEQRNRPPVEVWSYPKDAGPGLDGRKPKRRYYFSKRGELTVFSGPPSRSPTRRPF